MSVPDYDIRTLFVPDGIRLVKKYNAAIEPYLRMADDFDPADLRRHPPAPGDNLMLAYVHHVHPAGRVLQRREHALADHVREWMDRHAIPDAVFGRLHAALLSSPTIPDADTLARLNETLVESVFFADPVAALEGRYRVPSVLLMDQGAAIDSKSAWFRRYTDRVLAGLDRLIAERPDDHSLPEAIAAYETELNAWLEQEAIVEWWGENIDMRTPLPIGDSAIRRRLAYLADEPHKQQSWHLSPAAAFGHAALDRFVTESSPFTGDLYCAFVLTGRVGTTIIDAFPLVQLREDASPRMTSAVKFRIDGDPEEPGASAFMQNVRAWWAPFAGKALPKPRGKPGPKRPRIPLTFELVKKTYFELARGYRGEATPTLENVAEAIRNDPDNGIATVSGRTLRRRFNLEWTDREWPPVE